MQWGPVHTTQSPLTEETEEASIRPGDGTDDPALEEKNDFWMAAQDTFRAAVPVDPTETSEAASPEGPEQFQGEMLCERVPGAFFPSWPSRWATLVGPTLYLYKSRQDAERKKPPRLKLNLKEVQLEMDADRADLIVFHSVDASRLEVHEQLKIIQGKLKAATAAKKFLECNELQGKIDELKKALPTAAKGPIVTLKTPSATSARKWKRRIRNARELPPIQDEPPTASPPPGAAPPPSYEDAASMSPASDEEKSGANLPTSPFGTAHPTMDATGLGQRALQVNSNSTAVL